MKLSVGLTRRPHQIDAATIAQGCGWTLGTFLPICLKTIRHLSALGTGSYLRVLILGTFCCCVTGAYLADTIGRKSTFMISAAGTVLVMLVYLLAPLGDDVILPVGFIPGWVNLHRLAPAAGNQGTNTG